jgi:hypothetical protein
MAITAPNSYFQCKDGLSGVQILAHVQTASLRPPSINRGGGRPFGELGTLGT